MKVAARILSLFTLLAVATLYTSCGGGDDPKKTDEEKQLDKLKANVWNLTEATFNGTENRTDEFNLPNVMTLTFSGSFKAGGPYIMDIDNRPTTLNPWPSSSQWTFGPNVITTMFRLADDPDLEMGYVLTDSQLIISFNFQGAGFAGGRVEQVNGNWEFIFNKP